MFLFLSNGLCLAEKIYQSFGTLDICKSTFRRCCSENMDGEFPALCRAVCFWCTAVNIFWGKEPLGRWPDVLK
uniref:Uncharacterized protein n=1 Tax=Gadus morhua TaxID=8049 RepID=A0A8C5BE13_GADMO